MASFVEQQNQKEHKCPTEKLWYIHIVGYHTAIKMNEYSNSLKWIKLKNLISKQIRKIHKADFHFIWLTRQNF